MSAQSKAGFALGVLTVIVGYVLTRVNFEAFMVALATAFIFLWWHNLDDHNR